MMVLSWNGVELRLGNLIEDKRIHLTHIHTSRFEDRLLADEETVVSPNEARPDLEYLDRKIILGSRVGLVAPMQYSPYLTEAVIEACRTSPVAEEDYEPNESKMHLDDQARSFIRYIVNVLMDRHGPVRDMRALKDDFSYALAYLPPWKTSYRVQRNSSDVERIEDARRHSKRPVYILRENSYLWDYRRKLTSPSLSIMGPQADNLLDVEGWNDVMHAI